MIRKDQIYRHYKGGLYRILAVGLHVETQQRMIVYKNINENVVYTDIDNVDKIWIREESIFVESFEQDGKTIKRFALVD